MLDAVQQDPHGRREAQARGPSACHHWQTPCAGRGPAATASPPRNEYPAGGAEEPVPCPGRRAYSRSPLSLPSAATPLGAPRCPPPAANPRSGASGAPSLAPGALWAVATPTAGSWASQRRYSKKAMMKSRPWKPTNAAPGPEGTGRGWEGVSIIRWILRPNTLYSNADSTTPWPCELWVRYLTSLGHTCLICKR